MVFVPVATMLLIQSQCAPHPTPPSTLVVHPGRCRWRHSLAETAAPLEPLGGQRTGAASPRRRDAVMFVDPEGQPHRSVGVEGAAVQGAGVGLSPAPPPRRRAADPANAAALGVVGGSTGRTRANSITAAQPFRRTSLSTDLAPGGSSRPVTTRPRERVSDAEEGAPSTTHRSTKSSRQAGQQPKAAMGTTRVRHAQPPSLPNSPEPSAPPM